MAPNLEDIREASERLSSVTGTLSASATAILLGQSVELSWNVTDPDAGSGRGLEIELTSTRGLRRSVGRRGSYTEAPFASLEYNLGAKAAPVTKNLDSVSVRVDASHCTTFTMSAADVRTQMVDTIEARYGGSGTTVGGRRVWLRDDPQVSLSNAGINLKLYLEAEVDVIPDLDIDIDTLVILGARDGDPWVNFSSFSLNLDWPWWFDVTTGGIATLVEAWIDDDFVPDAKENIRTSLLEKIKEQLALYHTFHPDDILTQLTVTARGLDLKFCAGS